MGLEASGNTRFGEVLGRSMTDAVTRRGLKIELLIVLGLSLGRSGIYAIVNLIDKMTRAPLGSQTTSLNNSLNQRQYFDLTYQLLDIFFALVPVMLVFYLLWRIPEEIRLAVLALTWCGRYATWGGESGCSWSWASEPLASMRWAVRSA